MTQYFGGIEAGGTKFICGIGKGDGNILHHAYFPTSKPEDTIPLVIDFFLNHAKDIEIDEKHYPFK